MPGRITPLVNGQYYHIFNRGSDKRNIFSRSRDYQRFQLTFYYYQFTDQKKRFSKLAKSDFKDFNPDPATKLVEILCYCLMPNHFHFLVKQLKNNGIPIFMSKLCNSYTKYFNTKYPRVGPLLQGKYQNVLIENEEQLIHLSRYIHLNPVVSGIVKSPENYQWSSYPEYITGQKRFCNLEEILNLFKSSGKYQEFVEAQIDYGMTLEILKHRTIDVE